MNQRFGLPSRFLFLVLRSFIPETILGNSNKGRREGSMDRGRSSRWVKLGPASECEQSRGTVRTQGVGWTFIRNPTAASALFHRCLITHLSKNLSKGLAMSGNKWLPSPKKRYYEFHWEIKGRGQTPEKKVWRILLKHLLTHFSAEGEWTEVMGLGSTSMFSSQGLPVFAHWNVMGGSQHTFNC